MPVDRLVVEEEVPTAVRITASAGASPMGRVVTVRDVRQGVTDDGMIMTGVDRRHVPVVFEPVLTAAIHAVREHADQAALHVYGSVATGQARTGESDVDLLSIGLEPGVAATVSKQLSEQFAAVCRAVEIGPAERSHYVGQTDEAYGNRVFLRHYCLYLAGGNPITVKSAYRADARAARGFNGDIGQHSERWRAALETVEDTAAFGKRMARKTLFAVAGLVSVHDATWTTDRQGAAQRWAAIDPSFANGLEQLFKWSENLDTPSASELSRALDGIVADIVAALP